MVDFNCCDHECACQHNGHLEAAQQYSSILSKVISKNADSEYVSKEDKDNWNSKANKDLVDLIKVMVEKHEERLDDLEDGLDKKIKLILYDFGFGDNLLAKYATIEYVNELVAKIKNDTADLSKYALKTDLDTIKNDIQNKINNLTTEINNIKVTGGKDYSIESMEYKNNQLVLKQKNGGTFTVSIISGNVDTSKFVTKEQLAAELTKYAEINKLKRIRVKGNVHSLYGNGTEIIDIPTGGGGGGNDGKDGGYYKQYFKNNTSETVAPEKPTDGSAPSAESGWTENAVNRKSGEYTWMIQVFVSGDGLYGHYMTPICITGSKGDQGPQGPAGSSGTGADTNDRDFRYYRTEKGHDIEKVQKPDGDNYYDWTDNPQGVGVDKETGVFYDNEWVCVRIKTDGVWGEWIGPVLWSHYGESGTDGDGVEYIFTKTSTGTLTEDPSTWYTNEQSKANGQDSSGSCSWEDNSESYYNTKYFNQDEYIKKDSGWFDDPSNIEDQHPGDKIWVSVRKKRNDSNPTSSETEDAYWHQYSQPKIWSYYAKDGVVDAVIIDVVGETRYVYINPVTKLSKKYDASVTVNMFNSGDTITKTLEFVSFKKSDGTDMSSLQSSFTFTNDAVAVNFAENALNFKNDAYYTLTLVGTPQDMTDQKRYAEISFYGISNEGIQAEPGKDGVTAGIYTTASAISYQDGSFYPNEIGVSVRWGEGKTLTEYTPENPGGWQFSYMVDDGDWTEMSTNDIQSQGKLGISFKAHKDNINLQEYVPIIKSGIDGLNGVTYKTIVRNMQLQYTENSDDKDSYSIDAMFNVGLYKKEGNKDYVQQDISEYECAVSKNPASTNQNISAMPTEDQTEWECSVTDNSVNSKNATIQIVITHDGGAFVDSISIPVSAAGKDGEAATGQTLKGNPLRIRGTYDKNLAPYYDGKRVSDQDGVFYQDIVLHNNMYYACINTQAGIDDNWQTDPGAGSSYWQAFTINKNAFYDLLMANKAHIKELSSNEIVIFNGDNQDKKIVAGMTSGNAVDEKSDLNGTVDKDGKGNVRIWAGEFTGGDLTTAPFTVTDEGNVVAHTATLYDATFYAANAEVKITNNRFTNTSGSTPFTYENAGLYVSGNSEEYGDSKMFFGMQSQFPLQIGGSDTKTTTPIMTISNSSNNVAIMPNRLLINGQGSTFQTFGDSFLYGYTQIGNLGRFIRNDSLKAELDDNCSISINAGTFGSLGTSGYEITLPADKPGRDIIIVNPKWDRLTVKAPSNYTLYKNGASVSEVRMSKYTMAHAIQIGDKAWIIGMMS